MDACKPESITVLREVLVALHKNTPSKILEIRVLENTRHPLVPVKLYRQLLRIDTVTIFLSRAYIGHGSYFSPSFKYAREQTRRRKESE